MQIFQTEKSLNQEIMMKIVKEETQDDTGPTYQIWVKQKNMCVTCEPDGCYLFHYTSEPATRRSKAARQAAVGLHEWMAQHGVDETMLVIGGDSNNSNTGWKG